MVKTGYDPTRIEAKWRRKWEETGLYQTDLEETDDKLFVLVMFIYPSGAKLHIGHWFNYSGADTWARARRMQGWNVLEPMGYDAFGLPAENFALKHGIHPAESTEKNVNDIRIQLKEMGAMYDWSKEINTSEPGYYKWTQWFFLKLYEHGLAYKRKAPVNWCPSCKTVLANEQVVGEGTCERCGSGVEQKDLEQWFFKITDYAQKLLDGLEKIQWPEKTVMMQKNWIGRSEGTEMHFPLVGRDDILKVFTTRPDTIYGATYMVMAPEHPLIDEITTGQQRQAVGNYVRQVRLQTEIERTSTVKEKTGVFTGAYAVNPFTDAEIPIWIADYVLMSYGAGAVMAVPAHDQRDFEFARKYDLPIVQVIAPEGEETIDADEMQEAYEGDGKMINSGPFSGMNNREGIKAVTEHLEKEGKGGFKINYRLRDWLISRQRYWGAPIPIINCDECGIVPVPENQLPVLLPRDVDFKPKGTGESPLATNKKFLNTECPQCGGPAQRETETMDTFVCSSWYYLRYVNPDYDEGPFIKEKVNAWLPVDQYVGGSEHAVGHLLYSRFFTKFLHDAGYVDFDEPFQKLNHQGMVRKNSFYCPQHGYQPEEEVEEMENEFFHKNCGKKLIVRDEKISKSKYNTVDVDKYLNKYGIDTFRTYLLFMGHFSEGGVWDDSGITGIERFFKRVRKMTQQYNFNVHQTHDFEPKNKTEKELRRKIHATVKQATHDIENFDFNTVIAALMELTNALNDSEEEVSEQAFQFGLKQLMLLIAPFAPHMAEELWEQKNGQYSIFDQQWPQYSEKALEVESVTIPVQINGKVRGTFTAPKGVNRDEALKLALELESVAKYTEGNKIKKVILVPDRLLSIVI